MRAQVIHSHGELDHLVYETDWAKPALAADEVLVRVAACAANYHDLFTLRGMPGLRIAMPRIPGIDFSGTVAELGSEVTGFAVGERVVADPRPHRGGIGLLGETRDGGLAEFCAVPADQLVQLPDSVPFVQAAALPVAYATAYRMMVTRGGVPLDGSWTDKSIFILGASGGVGTACVQLGKLSGARVLVVSSSPDKLAKLQALGADAGTNYGDGNLLEAIHSLVGKPRVRGEGGADVIVNFTGGDTWLPCIRSLHKHGRILTCGATAGFDVHSDLRFVWTFEQMVIGSDGWLRPDLLAMLDLVREGKVHIPIHATYDLADTGEAFAAMQRREVFGKVVVTVSPRA